MKNQAGDLITLYAIYNRKLDNNFHQKNDIKCNIFIKYMSTDKTAWSYPIV